MVDMDECYGENVIEPVRKALLVLENRLSQADIDGHGTLAKSGLHNSLPDITAVDDVNNDKTPKTNNDVPDSCDNDHLMSPPQLPARQHLKGCSKNPATAVLPPLPPKRHHPPPSSSSTRPAIEPFPHVDWFSNPLFDKTHETPSPKRTYSRYETSFIDTQLSSPHGLDTTLPDSCNFPYMDDVGSPLDVSRDSCFSEETADSRNLPSATFSAILPPDSAPPALPKKETKKKRPHHANIWDGHGNPPLRFLAGSQSFDCTGEGAKILGQFPGLMDYPGGGNGVTGPLGERRNSDGNRPPPLPPKKRDIINYMEMLGQSLLPTSKINKLFSIETNLLQTFLFRRRTHEKSGANSDFATERLG